MKLITAIMTAMFLSGIAFAQVTPPVNPQNQGRQIQLPQCDNPTDCQFRVKLEQDQLAIQSAVQTLQSDYASYQSTVVTPNTITVEQASLAKDQANLTAMQAAITTTTTTTTNTAGTNWTGGVS